jgi:hypothetical protein
MSKKHRGGPAPVPPGNRSDKGKQPVEAHDDIPLPGDTRQGQPDSERDPNRGIGNFEGKGEHARQEQMGQPD